MTDLHKLLDGHYSLLIKFEERLSQLRDEFSQIVRLTSRFTPEERETMVKSSNDKALLKLLELAETAPRSLNISLGEIIISYNIPHETVFYLFSEGVIEIVE